MWSISASALEEGTCATPQELSALVAAEGHKIFAQMERIGISLENDGATLYGAVLVTAKPDLSRWYTIRGDKPLDTPSTRMCISSTGRNLEVNDYRNDSQPTVTHFDFDDKLALKECETLKSAFHEGEERGIRCNSHYVGLQILKEDLNERLALQGHTDGGSLMTIIADPVERDFRILATGPQGGALIALSGRKFSFTDWVLDILNRQGEAATEQILSH